ncbi:MAG: hypothetical protein PWR13_1369 [Archaeoglobi archaeon]|nr:hypothetical protein [Archaeoglobi archaeon]
MRNHLTSSVSVAFLALPVGFATIPLEMSALLEKVGWMAYPIVEVLNVFLIDFPMSMLAGILFSIVNKKARVKDGMICGLLYLTILILLIFIAASLGNVEPMMKGITALQRNLGLIFPAWCVMFLLLDYGMCMFGGVLGVIVAKEFWR